MKLLFLRGAVPTDRDPRQIMFDDLSKCDDCWTQLAYHLCKGDYGEVWYWGGKRKVRYSKNFIERWVPRFNTYISSFIPDVIFGRGGFPQYDVVFKRYPKAFKIYYGAGKRFMPQSKFKDYNLILVDTPKQRSKSRRTFPNIKSELFVKPAADNVFKPFDADKEYDVIFSSNEHKAGIKGHSFILPRLPKEVKMVQTGIVSKKIRKKYPSVHFTGWIPRRKLPEYYAKSKVSVVCCTNVDSCPRVIPESLACNCPMLILNTVNLWRDRYITPETGNISSSKDFISLLRIMIQSYKDFSPREYYDKHLSLTVAAVYLKGIIDGVK